MAPTRRPPPARGTTHIALLLSHRSIRGYRPDALPAGTLETLIAAAQSAATSSNLQTWSVIAVTDPARKAALAKVAANQKHIEQCPLFLVWVADISRNQRLGAEEGVTLETMPYQETFTVAAIDAALAAQNATVAAESLGLSCVYIGALRNNPLEVGRIVGLPPGAFGVFGMCVGYASATAANEVKPRLPQDVVLHREVYDATRRGGASRGLRRADGGLFGSERHGGGHLDQAGHRADGQDRGDGGARQDGRRAARDGV